MAGKVVEFPKEQEKFEDVVIRSMRGLFARDTARQKELAVLIKRNMELEEIVFRINNRLDHITEVTPSEEGTLRHCSSS